MIRDYSNRDIQTAIDDWIHHKRNREILKRRLIDGICYEPLAEEFDMSVRQVKAIVYSGEKVIYSHLDRKCDFCDVERSQKQ